VSASDWINVLIAGLGIAGTLSATVLAQRAEARRANQIQQVEADRRAEDRRDALERERREAVRSDYREILRYIARTRLFVSEMRSRLAELEYWSAHLSSDAREVEDLEARAQVLRRNFFEELPDLQSLAGAWGPLNLIAILDEIDDFGPKIVATLSLALHLKIDGKRFADATVKALNELDQLVTLLDQARDLLYAEQRPQDSA
jgi:predicted RNase H-like nuclease (RuvC/YqgF family)